MFRARKGSEMDCQRRLRANIAMNAHCVVRSSVCSHSKSLVRKLQAARSESIAFDGSSAPTLTPQDATNDRVPPLHIGMAEKSMGPKRSPMCSKAGHVSPPGSARYPVSPAKYTHVRSGAGEAPCANCSITKPAQSVVARSKPVRAELCCAGTQLIRILPTSSRPSNDSAMSAGA